MRFISPHRKFGITYWREVKKVNAHGTWYEQEPVYCQFVQGHADPDAGAAPAGAGLTTWEEQAGLQRFHPRGLPEGLPFEYRFSVFDTDEAAREQAWDDELKEAVEAFMLSYPAHGNQFLHVPTPELEAPWPNYADTRWDHIAPKTREMGYDRDYVIAYERAHENRDNVIEALMSLKDDALVGEIAG